MSKYERYAKDEMEEIINSWEERYKKALEGYRDEKKELIEKFIKSWNYMMDRVVFHTENPDSELMGEIEDELMKWEGELKK